MLSSVRARLVRLAAAGKSAKTVSSSVQRSLLLLILIAPGAFAQCGSGSTSSYSCNTGSYCTQASSAASSRSSSMSSMSSMGSSRSMPTNMCSTVLPTMTGSSCVSGRGSNMASNMSSSCQNAYNNCSSMMNCSSVTVANCTGWMNTGGWQGSGYWGNSGHYQAVGAITQDFSAAASGALGLIRKL